MFGLELRDLVENLLLRRDPLPQPFAGAGHSRRALTVTPVRRDSSPTVIGRDRTVFTI